MNFKRNHDPLLAIGGTHNRMYAFKVHDYGDPVERFPDSSCSIVEAPNTPTTSVYDQELESPWVESHADTHRTVGNLVLYLTAPEESIKSQSSQVS